jgi:hypothetical protein
MIPLSLGFSQGRSPAVSDGQDVNVFPCINQDDAKAPLTLSERPGLKRLFKPAGASQVRGGVIVGRTMYSVVGSGFFETNLDTLQSTLIYTLPSDSGKAWVERNANSQVLIVTPDKGFVFNWFTREMTQILDEDFPGAVSLAFLQQYAITVDPDSGRLRNCELNDFTNWEGTAFVTAEAAPDNLLAIIADHKEIVALGASTTEIYRNSGDVAAVFQSLDGGFFEIGINAPASVAKVSNVVLFLDNTLQVRLIESYSPLVVSTDNLSYQIGQMSRTDDAEGMGYIWRGHAFYVLTFPTANRTFAYDVTSSALANRNIWHELRSFPVDSENRWRGSFVLQDNMTVYVGDHSNGWIYTLDENTHTDNLEPMQRLWTCAAVNDKDRNRLIFHLELELEVEMGVGTEAVETPQVEMTYSDDNGKTWSSGLLSSIGGPGEYKNRARWFGLGSARNRIYRFMISDDVKVEVVGVYLRAEMGVM